MTFMEAHTGNLLNYQLLRKFTNNHFSDKLVLERFPFLDTPYPLASILIAYLVFIYWIGPRQVCYRKYLIFYYK